MNVRSLAERAVTVHGAQQKPDELAALGQFILDRGYHTGIEIGTYAGGTAWFLREVGLRLTVVDLNLTRCPQLPGVTYLQAASLDAVVDVPVVDFVFIDGDHSYAGVKADWDAYRRKVLPGCAIGFHDIVDHFSPDHDLNCHVDQLWAEIKRGHQTLEFVSTEDTDRWGGIGVVVL